MTSQSSLPVLDGVIGSLMSDSAATKLKGLVSLATLLAAVATLAASIRSRFWLGVIVSAPICAIAMLMNQYEVWALVRFSKILILPVAYHLSVLEPQFALHPRLRTWSVAAVFFVCVSTNLAYGYYVARLFFA